VLDYGLTSGDNDGKFIGKGLKKGLEISAPDYVDLGKWTHIKEDDNIMFRGKLPYWFFSFVLFLTAQAIHAQLELTYVDIGDAFDGKIEYDKDKKVYTMTSNGDDDFWDATDGGGFAYIETSGDFVIEVQILEYNKVRDWQKTGPMIRENLEPGSKNALAAATGDWSVTFQTRSVTGGNTGEWTLWDFKPKFNKFGSGDWIRLERAKNKFTPYYQEKGSEEWIDWQTQSVDIGDAVLAGFGVSSLENAYVTVKFVNFTITTPGGVKGDIFPGNVAVSAKGKLVTTWSRIKSKY